MKIRFAVGILALCSASATAAGMPPPHIVSLDGEWMFSRDGGAWETVEVPHDWAIQGPFDPKGDSGTGKLPWRGTGVYRRSFDVNPRSSVWLVFDGVMARPEVFVNGVKVGGWDYGYMSFACDATAAVRPGSNELEVRASTLTHRSRWYPGGGIYRSVRLVVCGEDDALPGSVEIVQDGSATGRVARVDVRWRTAKGERGKTVEIENPVLWSPETPHLYTVEAGGETHRFGLRTCAFTADDGFHLNGARYQIKGANLHSDLGPLGMAFDADAARRQLRLLKDMGVNAIRTAHNPPAPAFLDLCDEMGFLVWDECFDKWDDTASRLPEEDLEDYVERNLRAFVRRDRNHPSVVCWSIGNEIAPASETNPDGQTAARVARFAAAVREEDATRPVGSGNCHPEWFGDKSIFAPLDVTGWNYQHAYAAQHAFDPRAAVVMTESAAAVSSSGWYGARPPANKTDYATNATEVSSWDSCAAPFSDIPDVEFHRVERDRYCAGEFVWTGIDYLGEPTPYDYVIKGLPPERQSRSSYFGCIDLTGVPKDRFWLYRSHWNESEHTVHLVRASGAAYVYTDGDEAELFLNGRSLGRRRKLASLDYPLDFIREWPRGESCAENPYYAVCDKYRLRWFDVPDEEGELVAAAYRNGKEIGRDVSRTGGTRSCASAKATRLVLEEEPGDGELCFIHVKAVDAAGTLVRDAAHKVSFALEGQGRIVAVANGDARDYESFKATSSHSLYNGRALVIVRCTAPGAITLTATADGLKEARLQPRTR